ncbi:phospholipid scramblase 2-like [Ornithodoros turicata]|uniref:phospholipid scramblase 2-like n=1 Tax=Ornithodoros turicata TaxID=34597 RepID=UPI003139506F
MPPRLRPQGPRHFGHQTAMAQQVRTPRGQRSPRTRGQELPVERAQQQAQQQPTRQMRQQAQQQPVQRVLQQPVQQAQQPTGQRYTSRPPSMAMPVVAASAVCPPGLEYLCVLDQLIIKQMVELFEVLIDFETQNKYVAYNNQSQNVYYMAESSGCCTRYWVPDNRCFQMFVVDTQGRVVIRLVRPLRCQSTLIGCCCCLLQEMQVEAPPDELIGSVYEECSACQPAFRIYDTSGNLVLRVLGPRITASCPWQMDVRYQILTLNGSEIGVISKVWGGLLKEMFTDADTFSLTFPFDLDVRIKACLLGCAILIDYMFFETVPETD